MHVISITDCGACRRNWNTGLDFTGKGSGPINKIVRLYCPTCESKDGWGEIPVCTDCAKNLLLNQGTCTKGHMLDTCRTKPVNCYRAAAGDFVSTAVAAS